jgi:Fur family ferric uptake transcriptional regulator
VHRLRSTDDHARFELSEELGGHHHHLVCVACGTVADFTPSSRFEQSLEGVIHKAASSTDFRPVAHRLDVLGTCGACAE